VPLLLDLVRHGQAMPASNGGDAVRPLSPTGRETVGHLADQLAREGWTPGALFSSPLTRARETAAILARARTGLEPDILIELVPDADPEDVEQALAERDLPAHVVLVGHQPLMDRLVSYLTGGPECGFAPGALVRLEFPDGLGKARGVIRMERPPERHL